MLTPYPNHSPIARAGLMIFGGLVTMAHGTRQRGELDVSRRGQDGADSAGRCDSDDGGVHLGIGCILPAVLLAADHAACDDFLERYAYLQLDRWRGGADAERGGADRKYDDIAAEWADCSSALMRGRRLPTRWPMRQAGQRRCSMGFGCRWSRCHDSRGDSGRRAAHRGDGAQVS